MNNSHLKISWAGGCMKRSNDAFFKGTRIRANLESINTQLHLVSDTGEESEDDVSEQRQAWSRH